MTEIIVSRWVADVVQVAARRDGAQALCAALADGLGLAMPPAGRAVAAGGVAALWIQPQTWLVLGEPAGEGVLARRLAGVAGPVGSVVDQSHGRAVFRLAGPGVREVLTRLCRVDVAEVAFPPGAVAATLLGGIAGVLWCRGAQDFALVVPGSYADWFAEVLGETCAGFAAGE